MTIIQQKHWFQFSPRGDFDVFRSGGLRGPSPDSLHHVNRIGTLRGQGSFASGLVPIVDVTLNHEKSGMNFQNKMLWIKIAPPPPSNLSSFASLRFLSVTGAIIFKPDDIMFLDRVFPLYFHNHFRQHK